MGNSLLSQLNTLMFPEIMRDFFGMIDKFIYFLMEKSIDLMYDLANNRFGLENEIDGLISNFYVIFIIFMIFKLTISMLNYIVNPEAFTDKNAGFSKLVSRVIIAVILLVSINPLFNFLYTLQSDILGTSGAGNVIDNLILSNQEMKTITIDGEEVDIYLTRMSDDCPENYKVYSLTKGGMFAISALKPFYQPTPYGEVEKKSEWEDFLDNSAYGYCGLDFTDENTIKDSYKKYYDYSFSPDANGNKSFLSLVIDSSFGLTGIISREIMAAVQSGIGNDISIYGFLAMPHAGSEFIKHDIFNNITGNWDWHYNEVFTIDFRYFWALVFGIALLFMIITFCFDIVVRALTLFLYQLIAPIPIISYMSPNKKDTDMLMNWVRRTLTCWASIFVRIAILDFVIYFSHVALNALDNSGSGIVTQIFILVGTLMFAKKLPKLLEEIIPALKMEGGLELNPFKRISRDALGGNLLLGAGAGIAGMGLAAGTNFAHRGIQTGRNVIKAEGAREKLRALRSGLGRTAGSTIAGGFRGFTNSFNRTRKDGNVFGGAWNGYQTAMFSKLIREDNLRKAGIINADGSYASYVDKDGNIKTRGIMDNVKFAAGSVGADLARYGGILNKGQQEYLMADEIKKQIESQKFALNQEKKTALNPYTQYMEVLSKLSSRLEKLVDDDGEVKKAKDNLDNAIAAGNHTEADLQKLRDKIKEKKDIARKEYFAKDQAVKLYKAEADKMLQDHKNELGNYEYFKKDQNDGKYTFNKDVFVGIQGMAESIAYQYGLKENAIEKNVLDSYGIDEKRYAEIQSESSVAKLQNAIRTNMDVQKPGFKPSGNGSIQSRVTDSSQYSNLGHQGHPGGHHGGGPGPGPGPGAP